MKTSQPWWLTDEYVDDLAIPEVFRDLAGPHGLALVKAFADGKTQQGWGLQGAKTGLTDDDGNELRKPGFMPRYAKEEFREAKAMHSYLRGSSAFAFVMRSVKMICIDIDGKNDGIRFAKRLGPLPPTLAETSKSGNGYHLFYLVPDSWEVDEGFARFNDVIGIEQGVDIRATGCVFHYPTQRWNERALAELPDFMVEKLEARQRSRQHDSTRIAAVLDTEDIEEILMMHAELIADLKKPIPAGKRNNTLFAIGSKMKAAQVEKWEDMISDRAAQVGLDPDEIDKLVGNITSYA